jgi:hypothetical protein
MSEEQDAVRDYESWLKARKKLKAEGNKPNGRVREDPPMPTDTDFTGSASASADIGVDPPIKDAIPPKAKTPVSDKTIRIIESLPEFIDRVNKLPQLKEYVPDLAYEEKTSLAHGQPRSLSVCRRQVSVVLAGCCPICFLRVEAFRITRFLRLQETPSWSLA